MGPKCEFTGVDCDVLSSRCANHDEKCYASGPGKDMFESTKIIAERIMKGGLVCISAKKLDSWIQIFELM